MKNNSEHLIGGRYPMCKDQPAQIDCRNGFCKYHNNGTCTNVSPAITLNVYSACYDDVKLSAKCWSFEEKEKPVSPSNI